jgi:hypothetical protein
MHLLIWRIHRPQRAGVALLKILMATLVYILFFVWICSTEDRLLVLVPRTSVEYVYIVLVNLSLSLA